MSHRRAIYASRFLRPPSYTKRLLLREKPRELTGPYENPVRRWVRLREKARLFAEMPPPRRSPVPKPAKRKFLQAVEAVPRVSAEALNRRLEFLLSPSAIQQQLAEPMRPGLSVQHVEFSCWERQVREIRRVYRAQYLHKLAEVTEVERQKEYEMNQKVREERRLRKEAHMRRVSEDMKRRAILKDRKQIEDKVNEALMMARRSKSKRQRLFWYRRLDSLSKLTVTADNFEKAFSQSTKELALADQMDTTTGISDSGVLLSRNVSVPFLLRQLGGAKSFPRQKSRRIHLVDNPHREALEMSYDILPEDEPRFDPEPAGVPSAQEHAKMLYSGFTHEEKIALLDQKIAMIKEKIKLSDATNQHDQVAVRLLDELESARLAAGEPARVETFKATARAARGDDPKGMPAPFAKAKYGAEQTTIDDTGKPSDDGDGSFFDDVDIAAKEKKDDGNKVFQFGKYRGERFKTVAQKDPSYGQWASRQQATGMLLEYVDYLKDTNQLQKVRRRRPGRRIMPRIVGRGSRLGSNRPPRKS